MSLENPFWMFALKVYKDPQVQSLCLAWQSQGASVNRVLFCCWLAQASIQIQDELAVPEADLWRQQTLEPLRGVRYQVKTARQTHTSLDALYATLKEAELQAEQIEIAYLWQAHHRVAALRAPQEPVAALARHNLQIYFQHLPKAQVPTENQVHQLVDRIFPSV